MRSIQTVSLKWTASDGLGELESLRRQILRSLPRGKQTGRGHKWAGLKLNTARKGQSNPFRMQVATGYVQQADGGADLLGSGNITGLQTDLNIIAFANESLLRAPRRDQWRGP